MDVKQHSAQLNTVRVSVYNQRYVLLYSFTWENVTIEVDGFALVCLFYFTLAKLVPTLPPKLPTQIA